MMTSLLVGMSLAMGQVDPPRPDETPAPTVAPAVRVPIKLKVRPAVKWSPQDVAAAAVVRGSAEAQEDRTTPEVIKAPAEGNGNANGNGNGNGQAKEEEQLTGLFPCRLFQAYCNEFKPKNDSNGDEETPSPTRRAAPAPFNSPPFPTAEYQGFPLIGVPVSDTVYPLMKAIYSGPCGEEIKASRIKGYGWINGAANISTSDKSNTIDSYWVVPNRLELDQAIFRLEREVDTAQTDHIDWGFRSTHMYGIDYRYTTAGGWFSRQLLANNRLYGYDPVEQYFHLYVPGVAQGMIVTAGRWVATPDIETQLAPDNYMGTHSILFTVDVYTETGIMTTVMLNEQWTVQAALHAGADMAPWYEGAVPTGMFGVRWVAPSNNNSVYTVLNSLNNARFRYFDLDGQPAGHHNYNIFQSTWQHTFSKEVHTKTEAYIMWERDAAVGGTPSIGPFKYNSGGGIGPTVPGVSLTYGVLNYTMIQLTKKDYLTVRNEWVKDEHGTRYGFAGNYTSHSIGLSHNFNSVFQVRPEVGYYRNYNNPAFDNGARKEMWLAGVDMTLRF